MRVPCGRRRLRMAQKLANYRKGEARARANRREGVSKVMDAHAFEARVPLYRPPRLLQARSRPAYVGSRYDEGSSALAIPQEVHCGGAHDDRLSTRLAVGQVDQPALKIDMAPLEGQDLLQSRAGEHEETKGKDDLWRENRPSVLLPDQMLALGFVDVRAPGQTLYFRQTQRFPETVQLFNTEIPLARKLAKSLDALRRIRAPGNDAAARGEAVHARDHRDHAVCLIRPISQRQVKLRDFRRGYMIRCSFPELRHEIAAQDRRVVGCRSRLALWLHMLGDEKLDELRDRHRRIRFRPLLRRVLSGGDRAQNGLGLAARFVWCDCAVSPEHHEAPWTRPSRPAGPVAKDVGLGSAFRDPEREPL